jgi:hypothetical protein
MMLSLLQSVVGGPGPLIVEHNGKIFIENCMMISEKHVNKMYCRFKDLVNKSTIQQTSDRSFVITTRSNV